MPLQLTYELHLPEGFIDPMFASFFQDIPFWSVMLPVLFIAACVITGIIYLIAWLLLKRNSTKEKSPDKNSVIHYLQPKEKL